TPFNHVPNQSAPAWSTAMASTRFSAKLGSARNVNHPPPVESYRLRPFQVPNKRAPARSVTMTCTQLFASPSRVVKPLHWLSFGSYRLPPPPLVPNQTAPALSTATLCTSAFASPLFASLTASVAHEPSLGL